MRFYRGVDYVNGKKAMDRQWLSVLTPYLAAALISVLWLSVAPQAMAGQATKLANDVLANDLRDGLNNIPGGGLARGYHSSQDLHQIGVDAIVLMGSVYSQAPGEWSKEAAELAMRSTQTHRPTVSGFIAKNAPQSGITNWLGSPYVQISLLALALMALRFHHEVLMLTLICVGILLPLPEANAAQQGAELAPMTSSINACRRDSDSARSDSARPDSGQ